jgi:hypothetical protein
VPDELPKGIEDTEMHSPSLPVVLRIDGANFPNLKGFYDEVERVTLRRPLRERTLLGLGEGFDEVVLEKGPVAVAWVNSQKSREDLGYPETVRQLEIELNVCSPTLGDQIREDLDLARRGEGSTVFSWLTQTMASRKGVTVRFE